MKEIAIIPHRMGYAGLNTTLKRTTNQTCRLQNVTPEKIADVIHKNLDALEAILDWNFAHEIELVPHRIRVNPVWLSPRQHAGLACPVRGSAGGNWAQGKRLRAAPDDASWLVCKYQCHQPQGCGKLGAGFDLPYSSAGLFGNALGRENYHPYRWTVRRQGSCHTTVYRQLPPEIRQRLVLEHDDKLYTVRDVLTIHEKIGIPIVFDNLHHALNQ